MKFCDEALVIGKKRLSYSKLKLGSKCPFAYKHTYTDYTKPTDIVDNSSGLVGTFVHSVLEEVMSHFYTTKERVTAESVRAQTDIALRTVYKTTSLTEQEGDAVLGLKPYIESMCQRILVFFQNKKCKMLFEQKLAVDKDLNPIDYASKDAFFRGILDLVLIDSEGNVLVIDHKTGYRNPRAYEIQLRTYELLVFKSLPAYLNETHNFKIKSIQSGLSFIEDEAIDWNKKSFSGSIESEIIPWFYDWVNTIAIMVDSEVISRGSHCKSCGFKSLCGSRVGKGRKKKKDVTVAI